MQILGISGSIRARSSSTSLVKAAQIIAPPEVTFTVYDSLGQLPHFNPDLDAEGSLPPHGVAELRRLVGDADALLISIPEYAHGLPGSFKNALDWLVSSYEFPGIAVSVINPSAQSFHANESLIEILRTMSANLVTDALVRIPVVDRTMDGDKIARDPSLSGALRKAITALTAVGPRERLYQQ